MKVLLISAILVLTSDVACAETSVAVVTTVWNIAQKQIIAFAVANPYLVGGVIVAGVAIYGASQIYAFGRDFNDLNMWVDRITQRLKDNNISTDENSCWCMENPPPPLEEAKLTMSFFSKCYTKKLSTICNNDDLRKLNCQSAMDDCKAAVHIVRSLCGYG